MYSIYSVDSVYNMYRVYSVYSVYSMYSVYSVYSVYSMYSVNSVYSVYSVYSMYNMYSVNSVYSVYSMYSMYSVYMCCSSDPWVTSSDWGHKRAKELLLMLPMVSQKSKVRSNLKYYDRYKSIGYRCINAVMKKANITYVVIFFTQIRLIQ